MRKYLHGKRSNMEPISAAIQSISIFFVICQRSNSIVSSNVMEALTREAVAVALSMALNLWPCGRVETRES